MNRYMLRKIGAWMLVFALAGGVLEPALRIGAETNPVQEETTEAAGTEAEGPEENPEETAQTPTSTPEDTTPSDIPEEETPTETPGDETPSPSPAVKTVIVTPFAGQWKYFGQKRSFIQDVNYSVSDDEALPEGVSLSLASEEVGMQSFVLEDTRDQAQKEECVYQLKEPDAKIYEIKAYHVPDTVKIEDQTVNINRRATELTEDCIKLDAPEGGYAVSTSIGEEAKWGKDITVPLTEGENKITYYLSSEQEDLTRKAIDQTPRSVLILADWTAPQVCSVSGTTGTDVSAVGQITASEAGKFYYMVLPEKVASEEDGKQDEEGNPQGITTELIKDRVGSHYGIVGYGRVDETKPSDFEFNGLLAETNYVIYAFMEDDAGNESAVMRSEAFTTDRMALAGTVEITGTMALDETLTAKVNLDSAAPGQLIYQWYRIKNNEDTASLDEVWDETGGAEADDLEAEDDDDDDEDDDDEEDYELNKIHKLAEADADDVTTVGDGAVLIEGATQETYKATKDDIGYRLICQVSAPQYYSGYIAGESTTFIPKLIPEVTFPVIASAVYSPTRELSAIRLPERWNWVDDSIVPVYGNSGYRARYIPENTTMYRTVIVRVKVPVTKKSLAKKMLKLKKTYAYAGKAIKDNFYLQDGEKELVSRKDYKTTYRNNKKLGKCYITIKGAGNYKGTIQANYKIVPCSVKSLKYSYSARKIYTGKAKTAGVVIKNGTVRLKKNKDYTIVYKNNREIGRASVTIRGKGNYKGKKILHFEIVPSRPKITKVTKKKKSIRLKFSKNAQVSGYHIFFSTSKAFAKNKTQEYISTGNRFGINGLTEGTYYVRIKSYGTKNGKNYESSYSKSRNFKIKK